MPSRPDSGQRSPDLDIAVAGLRPVRLDAQGDKIALLRGLACLSEQIQEQVGLADEMVRGQHDHDAFRVNALQVQRGKTQRGRRIPGLGLEDEVAVPGPVEPGRELMPDAFGKARCSSR